ncbi:MAG: type II toxin-antitoxin system RelB/DinJ family antitoxin [Firmicutes bacterium]|nr:type II toxin-antitoxin system RelB/DinJ family antitoxin [Bacillota bacterium]
MSTSLVSARIENNYKERALKVFQRDGLDMSSAIRMFIVQTANKGVIPIKFSEKQETRAELNARVSAAIKKLDQEPVDLTKEDLEEWEY